MLKLRQTRSRAGPREDREVNRIVTVVEEHGIGESPLPMDSRAILASFGGQWELLKEIAEMTLADAPERVVEIENAIANREARALQNGAHQLRGSVSMFHPRLLIEILQRLERIGREGNLIDAEEYLPGLRIEFHRFSVALRNLIAA